MKPYQPTTGVAIGTTPALGAEQKARLQSPDMFIEHDARNNDALTAYYRTLDSGDPAAARQALDHIGQQQNNQATQAAAKAQQAQQEAAQAAQSSTGRSYEDIGASTYNTVHDEYLQPARKQKNELYGQVPNEVVPGSASMRDTAKGVINGIETPPAPAQAIVDMPTPGGAVGNTSGLADSYAGQPRHRTADQGAPAANNNAVDLTSQELMTIRREAIRVMRQSANSDPIKAQKAAELAGAASRLLYGDTSPEGVRSTLKAADDFYKGEFLPKFRQGPGKQIATRGPNGEEARMPPSRGMVSWIKPDTQKGAAEAAEQLKKIVGDDKAVVQNVRDHFFNLAAQKAIRKDGSVDPQAIRKIVTDHNAVLERFPAVKEALNRNYRLAKRAETHAAIAQELTAGAKAYERSIAGKIAASDTNMMIDKVLGESDPSAAVLHLKALMVDSGPEAANGLKQAFTDKLYSQITQTSRHTSATGQEIGELKLSAHAIENLIGKSGKYRAVMKEIYSPQDIRILDNLHEQMSRLQKLSNTATSGSRSAENAWRLITADNILKYVMQVSGVGGVAVGGYAGGVAGAAPGALVALAAWETRSGREKIKEIVNRAYVDADLAKAMLQQATKENVSNAIRIFDRIANNAPRIGVAAAAVTD